MHTVDNKFMNGIDVDNYAMLNKDSTRLHVWVTYTSHSFSVFFFTWSSNN